MRLTLHIGLASILVILLASPPGADAALLDGLKRFTGNAWEVFGSLTRAKVPANLPENPSTLHNTGVVSTVLPDANAPLRASPTREQVAEGLPLQPGSHVIEQAVVPARKLEEGSKGYGILDKFWTVLRLQKGQQPTFNVAASYERLGLRVEDFASYSRLSQTANDRINAHRLQFFEKSFNAEEHTTLMTSRAVAEEDLIKGIDSYTIGDANIGERFKLLGERHVAATGTNVYQGKGSALELRSTELRVALDFGIAMSRLEGLNVETRLWYARMAVGMLQRERRNLNRMFNAARSSGALVDANVLRFLHRRDQDVKEIGTTIQRYIDEGKPLFDQADARNLPKLSFWRSSFQKAFKPTEDQEEDVARILYELRAGPKPQSSEIKQSVNHGAENLGQLGLSPAPQ